MEVCINQKGPNRDSNPGSLAIRSSSAQSKYLTSRPLGRWVGPYVSGYHSFEGHPCATPYVIVLVQEG